MATNLWISAFLIIIGVSLYTKGVLLSGKSSGWPTAKRWLVNIYEVAAILILINGVAAFRSSASAEFLAMLSVMYLAAIEAIQVILLARRRCKLEKDPQNVLSRK